MEKKENQRVLLTKRLLKEGLLKMLLYKDLEKINVSELCREAGINRATFYKYYSIPRDVLRDVEKDMAGQLRGLAPEMMTKETAAAYLTDVCEYLYERRELIRILLRSNTEEELLRTISETNRRFWSRFGQNRDHELDENSAKLMVTYFSSGAYFMIRQWLLEGVEKSPCEIAELILGFMASA